MVSLIVKYPFFCCLSYKCLVGILCLLLWQFGVLCLLMFQFGVLLGFCVCCCGNLVFCWCFAFVMFQFGVFLGFGVFCCVNLVFCWYLCLVMLQFGVFWGFCVCCCGNFVFCWESKHCIDSHPPSHPLANCAYTDSQTRNQILDTCDDT